MNENAHAIVAASMSTSCTAIRKANAPPRQRRQDGVTRATALARSTHLAHFNHELLQPPDLAERDARINFRVAIAEALVQLAAEVVRPNVRNERGLWQGARERTDAPGRPEHRPSLGQSRLVRAHTITNGIRMTLRNRPLRSSGSSR